MNIVACVFKRQKVTAWENGVMINGDKVIIDMNGIPVPSPIYDYVLLEHELCINYRVAQYDVQSKLKS